MVLAVAAPSKRRRLESHPTDDSDNDDAESSSRSPSPAAGAQAIAHMLSSQRHPYHLGKGGIVPAPNQPIDKEASDEPPLASSSTKHRCDICEKTFARHEHMLRHRASHTDSASFSCDDCGKSFRRSDVLQRHRRLHATRKQLSLDANNAQLTKRQRSALVRVEAACLRCSSKKLKCDAAKPSCARCTRIPGIDCVYPAASDRSPASNKSRNRSASVMDESWNADLDSVDFSAHDDVSPVPPLNSHPAQNTQVSPAAFSAAGSSVGSSVPLATLTSTQHPHQYQPDGTSSTSSHPEAYLPPIHATGSLDLPPESLPASSHFPMSSSIETPRSFAHAASASFQPAAIEAQLMGATPGLVQMMQTPAPALDAATGLKDDRTLTDLLGWLDGPLFNESMDPGKIDWIFGDSPEAPQLLDWSQMQDWATFDLAARGMAPSVSEPFYDASALQPPPLHQRAGASVAPIQQQSPLFVLSSAAEMIDFNDRTPQSKTQQLASNHLHEPPSASPLAGVASPRPADSNQQGVVTSEAKATAGAGGRSRWNSPEPADDDMATSDSAKSDHLDGKREDAHVLDTDGAPNGTLRTTRPAKLSSVRRAAAMQAWPNRWNPAIKEQQLPSFAFTKASEEHLMSEDMAHVKRVSHAALVRMAEHLKNAAQSPLELERFNATFASIDAATLNIYLQLFFHHCYSYLPAIHQVTFHPDRCDPRLLAALCAIGAFFSEVPGSRNAAIYLASVTQISVSRATLTNHALARVTSTFQSILLVYMVWRSVGVPSRQEYAEAFRSTYCTMIRRARLLENISPPKLAADATIEDRWMAWVAWESGRRTAWSTLVSETELSLHWNLPEPFAPNELTGKLPCDDRLWEAPSAIEWAQTAMMLSPIHRGITGDGEIPPIMIDGEAEANLIWPDDSDLLDVSRACDIIQRTAQTPALVTEQERESLARMSPFSRLCVGSAVMLSTHHTMKMVRFCSMLLGDEEQARERMRTYLAAATDLLSTNQARDARVDLLLHAIQLFELVSPEMLQLLSCRRGVQRMHAARRQLSTELNEIKPWKTASIVFHAGQMLRLAKQSLQRAPVECLHIFYAAIALQAVSLLVLQQDANAPPGPIVRIAFNGPARSAVPQTSNSTLEAGTTRAWRADSSASIGSSTSPSSVGGAHSTAGTSMYSSTPIEGRAGGGGGGGGGGGKTTFMLESVGNLAHPMAPERVLSLASKWLRADDGVGVWPIGQSLAKILDSLATLTPRQSGVS